LNVKADRRNNKQGEMLQHAPSKLLPHAKITDNTAVLNTVTRATEANNT